MTEAERKQIIALVQREVVPAIGCTEPIAVALCVAKATETLGAKPEKIDVLLSANILKNAMGVGIPGTGMIGLPIAIALGALIGKSEYQLEVLKDSNPAAVEEGKRFIGEKRIDISLKKNITEKLYIEVCCKSGGNKATAIIAGGHTTFIYIARNGDVLLNKQSAGWQWKPGYFRYIARAGLCRGERQIGRRVDPCPHAQPSDRDLYQAKSGTSVCPVRLRSSRHRLQLRHYLAHGRYLRTSILCRSEHDCQPYRNDLRRRQTQLRLESNYRRLYRRPLRHHGYGKPLRYFRRRNY